MKSPKISIIFSLFICFFFAGCATTASVYTGGVETAPSYENLSRFRNSDSPLSEIIRKSSEKNTNYISVLNKGDDALLARIHLIRNAQKSIYIQTFIFSDDETCVFIAEELIKAARRGVQVKIIIDAFGMPQNLGIIAYMIRSSSNIEIKCYNPVSSIILPSKLALIEKAGTDFSGLNQRMHNKIFVVDNVAAITGGRNFQNDYFDRGIQRNFKDRDVFVVGPVVEDMSLSFAQYWGFELAVLGRDMNSVKEALDREEYRRYSGNIGTICGKLFDGLNKCEKDPESVKTRIFTPLYEVSKVEFISDKPGKTELIGNSKMSRTAQALQTFLADCKNLVVMQTPYLVAGKKMTRFFRKLAYTRPSVKFLVSSNSLAAADHVSAYAFSYKNKKKYLKRFRWEIFEFKPAPADADLMILPVNKKHRHKDYIACIHAKTYVVDTEKVWVGSFNISPRSLSLNTEAGLIAYDKQLASDIEEDIRRDIADRNSWTIGRRPAVPVVSRISRPLGSLIRAFPVIDVWPFTYSGCFELKSGKKPVPFYHPDFYDNYKYVGPFPLVRMGSEKEIKARLIKSFLGPAEPLI